MKVLVSVASRHGSTDEIATTLVRVLGEAGLEVDSRMPQEVTSVAEYDGVVVGSAIYVGRWLESAK
ncbi:MAG TPA: flavodoxin domain-containing protein, partial [Candidatus Limnocylindrales bacterium]